MRSHRLNTTELFVLHEGKTCLAWLQEIMFGNLEIDDSTYPDANLAAAHILVELHYRYVSAERDTRLSTSYLLPTRFLLIC
jgi:hypothetical protein